MFSSSDCLYLELCDYPERIDNDLMIAKVPMESLIMLCVYKYCKNSNIDVHYVKTERKSNILVPINILHSEENSRIQNKNEVNWTAISCELPVTERENKDGKLISSGIAAASRSISKSVNSHNSNVHPDGLLGFRQSCLQSPNETSVWTKFCEIEIVNTIALFISNYLGNKNINFTLPKDIIRFEYHLKQPIRVHNVYKLARELINLSITDDVDVNNMETNFDKNTNKSEKENSIKLKTKKKIIDSSTPIESLNLPHTFAEGPYLTLADIILYPCYYLFFSLINIQNVENIIPNTIKWYQNIKNMNEFVDINEILEKCIKYTFKNMNSINIILDPIDNVDKVSLYKCDPKRISRRKKTFTKNDDIELALQLINSNMEIMLTLNEIDSSQLVNWSDIPITASPYGGYLPDERMLRKSQQLENLANAVLKIAKHGDKIVDFCSGGGHLGILLAYLLPKCTIILLENKEQSLQYAQSRIKKLELNNVYCFQCNLDFFKGPFDIGVALHACGVSTDLVLENCIKNKASFVICPCCYGFLHETNRLKYPRSKEFSTISVEQYICIGHAADQTHENHHMQKRGVRCMQIIDSDRARYAMDYGYSVNLTRLEPLTCTPKNMLLIGKYDYK